MRKFAYLAATALMLVGVGTARAQVMVIDNSNIAQSITNTTNEINQLQSQLQQLQAQYNMFRNVPNVATGMLQGFNGGTMQNPLPTVSQAAGQIAGAGNTLNSYGQQFASMNQYTATGSDPVGTSLQQRTASLANIQGIAAQNLDSINERLNNLDQMKDELSNATDITQISAINGRIAVENQAIQAQAAAAQNLQMMAQAQMANQQVQEEEAGRADELKAAAWWKQGN